MAHQSLQAARMDIHARTEEDSVPGQALFQWMLRHAAWAQSVPALMESEPLGNLNGHVLQKRPLHPFIEACMITVPDWPSRSQMAGSTRTMVMGCSSHMEQSLNEQCED